MKNLNIAGWFGKIYSKTPDLSPEFKRVVVRLLPSLALVIGLLMIFTSVVEIVGTPFISVFTLGKSSLLQTLLLTNVLGIVQGILMISAFKSLRKRGNVGWKLMFWGQLLWLISSLISFSPAFILALLFLYPLFKVRAEYH